MTPNPTTIGPDVSVEAAFIRMRSKGFRHLLVVDENRLVGIVTDRDLRRPDLSDEPDGWHSLYDLRDDYEVRYVMTESVHTVRPQERLEKAVDLMVEHKFGALPVVDKLGAVVGILSAHDALRAFRQALKVSRAELRAS